MRRTVLLLLALAAAASPAAAAPRFRAGEAVRRGLVAPGVADLVKAARAAFATNVFARELRAAAPSAAAVQSLSAEAARILDGTLKSCGVEYAYPGRKVDWMTNHHPTGYREWILQLNRHEDLSLLARYYAATGDERAAAAWAEMIASWLDQMPAQIDAEACAGAPAWRTIETGIRLAAWTSVQFPAFLNAPSVSDELVERLCVSVWEHATRIRRHYTGTNWGLIELKGLAHAAALCPFFRDAAEWRVFMERTLEAELKTAVYPDGMENELAYGYHYGFVGDYLNIWRLYRKLGFPEPTFIRAGLKRPFEVNLRLANPQRVGAPHGDNPLPPLAWTCSRGLELYPDHEEFKWFATDGREGRRPQLLSTALPYAGLVAFRTSWERDAVWGFFDGGPIGTSHWHEDKLNFLMTAYGQEMVVEAPNWQYDSSDMRKYVISARAHNTIQIDGLEQCRVKGYRWNPADLGKKADLKFETTPARDSAASFYADGYGPERNRSVRHDRKVLFVKDLPELGPFFVVVDRLSAADIRPHAFEAVWHVFSPEQFAIQGRAFRARYAHGIGFSAATSDPGTRIVDRKGSRDPYQGWYPNPKAFDGSCEHIPIPTPAVCGSFKGSRRLVTVFVPHRDGRFRLAGVKASPSTREKTFTLQLVGGGERTLSE